MSVNTKVGIIIYIVLMIQGTVTAMALYLKAKKTPVLYSLLSCHVAMVIWLLFGIVENFSIGTDFYITSIRLTLLPIFFVGPLFMLFILFYIGIITSKRKRNLAFLVLLPSFICYLPLLTNTYLNLVIDSFTKEQGVLSWGTFFYVTTVISHIYFLLSSILVIYISIKEKIRIGQNILLVAAVMFSAASNILTGTKVIKAPGFDLVPISFSVVLAVISLLVFKYKIIDIVPFAYIELLNQVNSAVVILDREGNIDEYNEVFTSYFPGIIDLPKPINMHSILETANDFSADVKGIERVKDFLKSDDNTAFEDTVRIRISDEVIKQYTVSIVPLKTNSQNVIGKLVVIKDVTKYMENTLSVERKRLSGDLHDSLGNCINIISSNLEYAMKNYVGSQEIKECLEISYSKSTNAFLNLRRIVEELKPIDIENNGLLWALQSMFYKLKMKGIQIEFSYNDVNDKLLSKTKLGETIYYICQEAVNNSVIHGKAGNITITLLQINKQIKLYITDDGTGCSNIVKSNGLGSMESRVNTLGGSIEYGSPSEGGFNIRIIIPLERSIRTAV